MNEITILNSTYISACRMSRNEGLARFTYKKSKDDILELITKDSCAQRLFKGDQLKLRKYLHRKDSPQFDSLQITRSVFLSETQQIVLLTKKEVIESYTPVLLDSIEKVPDLFSIYDEVALMLDTNYRLYNGKVYDGEDTNFKLYNNGKTLASKSGTFLNCYFNKLYSLAFN